MINLSSRITNVRSEFMRHCASFSFIVRQIKYSRIHYTWDNCVRYVKVDIEVEQTAAPLSPAHGTTRWRARRSFTRLQANDEKMHEPCHPADDVELAGEKDAQRARKTRHPLPRDARTEQLLQRMSRTRVHAPRVATRAKRAIFVEQCHGNKWNMTQAPTLLAHRQTRNRPISGLVSHLTMVVFQRQLLPAASTVQAEEICREILPIVRLPHRSSAGWGQENFVLPHPASCWTRDRGSEGTRNLAGNEERATTAHPLPAAR